MSILEQVQEHVSSELTNKLPSSSHYHSLEHTIGVVETSQEIARAYDIEQEDFEDLIIASWFHDIGHIVSPEDHEQRSSVMASEYLTKKNHPKARISKIREIIVSTHVDIPSNGLLQEIIHDADIQSIGSKDFFSIGDNLRKEWEQINEMYYSQREWNELQLQFLESNNFFTKEAKRRFGPIREENIKIAKSRLDD